MSLLSERVKFVFNALVAAFGFYFLAAVGGFIIHNHVAYLALYDGVSVQMKPHHYIVFLMWVHLFPKHLWDANRRWYKLKEQNKNRF